MASNLLGLKWQDHNSTLVSVFQNLLEKNCLVDCTIAADGQYVKAHKIVLSACSSYFELLFSQESEKNPIVILKDVEFQELEAAVNFMYTGEVKVGANRLEAFLEVAESLEIKGLACDRRTRSSREKSSTLSRRISSAKLGVSPPQHTRTDALNLPSDSATEYPNVPVGCEPVRNNVNSAVHQSFQIESSRSSCTLPESSISRQGGQDTRNDEDTFENSRSSLTALTQVSSGENEDSDIKPAIKTDVCEEEKSYDADMDFVDELAKLEEQDVCDEHNRLREKSIFSEKNSSPKSVVSPRQHSRKDALNSPSDSATESPNVRVGCEPVRNNENSAVHQSFEIESSCSSRTFPQSSFSNQGGQDTQNDEDNFENSQSSLTALTQVSSGENEDSDIESAIESDKCEQEKSEDADMDFVDEFAKMEDQEDLDEHNVETESDQPSASHQDDSSGAEYDVAPHGPNKRQPTRSSLHFEDKETTSVLDTPDESQDSSMPPQKLPKAGRRIPRQCQKAFTSDHKLKKPMRHPKGKRVRKCPHCDYTAGCQSTITRHLHTHTRERPYKCVYCRRTFSQKGNLNTHLRIHTGDKPYQCPECNHKSCYSSAMVKHRRIHTGEKPYQCPECDFRCTSKSSLIVHRRIHSGEKPYQCPKCDYKANQLSHLRKHQHLHSGRKTK